mmetsp:Transcript_5276/g.6223  ORF Transcript_5276/g.6223 Transcript_5276/m.6223 type:complete len:122 (-) Transcript_5276:566-931(-)
MLGFVAMSRLGLWTFDLAITQITQENVLEESRGLVGSFQTTAYQSFFLFIQIIGMIISDPQDFRYLVNFSIGVVAFATVIYTLWWKSFSNSSIPNRLENADGKEREGLVTSKEKANGYGAT